MGTNCTTFICRWYHYNNTKYGCTLAHCSESDSSMFSS